ncbi:MAG TPA: hypothetical protein VFV99_29305 [Kofleriaceae bacterium]|nr:hypothetical protein [Kofleriaceae bacterium]
MVARGPGDVGCAHCTLIGADRPCPVCTHLVCERCASDWTTCSEPSGRVIRLGLTARVRDVDPSGRLALVSHWRQPLRVFDLRQLRWVRDIRLPRGAYLWNRTRPPRLTSDGRFIHAVWGAGTGYERTDTLVFKGMRFDKLGSNNTELVPSAEVPDHGTAVSPTRDVFYYVTDTQRVALIDGGRAVSVEPLPRKVVHSVYFDAERELLACGGWKEIVLDHTVDGHLSRVTRIETRNTGDVHWLALAGGWLVAAIWVSGTSAIEIRELSDNLAIGPVRHRHVTTRLRAAALSRDGRYFAFGDYNGLVVHELATDRTTVFTEHSDEINFVSFSRDDHTLISADTDNRVVMRPRTEAGYAKPVIAIDVPSEGVDLPRFQPRAVP